MIEVGEMRQSGFSIEGLSVYSLFKNNVQFKFRFGKQKKTPT
jgi:hypothetical protein